MPEVPRPVPLTELVRMRPAVANSYTVLCEAIRSELDARDDWDGAIPQDVVQPVLRRAIGWRVFCADAFVQLLCDQIAGEMTTPMEDDD